MTPACIARRGALAVLLVLIAGLPAAADVVGQVTRTQGTAMAVMDDGNRLLASGAVVNRDETLVTFAGGRLEVRIADGTVLTLGENASLRVDSFVFSSSQPGNRLALFTEGAFRLITGQINKMAGAAVSVTTPVGVLAVRGTDFWGGPIDGTYGVLLLEGAITVRTAGGEVVLDRPGLGTDIADAASAPGPIRPWGEAKVQRAFATVTFR